MTCPLCHSTNSKYQFTSNEFHGRYSESDTKFKYYRCSHCSSIYPNIKNLNLSNFYNNNYRKKSNILEKILVKINFFQTYLINKYIFKSKNISILDVGCGSGEYLNHLSNKYIKTGIDIKIDKIKSNLIQADFLKYKFTKKFDLITFNHSLEHLLNPQRAIIKAKSLLNTNGVIIISLPVSDSFSFVTNPSKAFHLDPPRHVFIPNSKKFTHILSNHFNSVTTISIPFEFPLDLLWTLKNSHQKYLIPIFPILKIIKPETKLFICRL